MVTGSVEQMAAEDKARSAESIARAFLAARAAGRPLSEYPGPMPRDFDDAYRIQASAIALSGQPVGGWKVGRVPDALVETFGSNRLAGPIFADAIRAGGETVPEMAVFEGGFGAVEAEYLLRLGAIGEAPEGGWTNAAAATCIDEIRIGIEIASSPFPGINDHGPAVTVSDFGNNHGLVLGDVLPRDCDFLNWPLALTINGAEAGTGTAAEMLDGPFGAVRFLLETAAERGLPVAPGQWISTGAVTGVHRVAIGDRVEARFGAERTVACTIGKVRQN